MKIHPTLIAIVLIALSSCNSKTKVDQLFYNGKIYTVDSSFTIAEAMVVTDGKIIAVGSNDELTSLYEPEKSIDVSGKYIYPGFHDSHCHFYGYGVDKAKINVTGTNSFEEVLTIVKNNEDKQFCRWVFGRGWDQNDWVEKEYPTNHKLDSLFPDVPVILLRVDGHAALLNSKGLELASLNAKTKIEGGKIILQNGKPTGIIMDNAIDAVYDVMEKISREASEEALLKAQSDCFSVGLTSVTDAGYQNGGLANSIINEIEALHSNGQLIIRVNAMARLEEIDLYRSTGRTTKGRLKVNGFKAYADGALGSRGACLLEPYSDYPESHGMLLSTPDQLRSWFEEVHEIGMQMNVHCIGDSSHRFVLKEYSNILKGSNTNRWRIEHAQVIAPGDLEYYRNSGIIPSVQPTHATSDMYWAEDRVGINRIKGAYAYQSLLECNGMILTGSDFPVESINPLFGFYAAVARKDQQQYPEGGFLSQESLSREDALKAMTIWSAYGAFNEDITGSIEPGKFADFVILEEDLMESNESELFNINVNETWVEGELVYKREE